MNTLVRTLAQTLLPELDVPSDPAPVVYTGAIRSSADLNLSLAGIIRLTRGLGFNLHPETLYSDDGASASYHADHSQRSVSLAVHCHPGRQTVSLAVSGLDAQETLDLYDVVERTLFGGL